jgi:hypothetical protein
VRDEELHPRPMNNRVLISCVERLTRGVEAELSFLSPIITAGLSAWLMVKKDQRSRIRLSGDAISYSKHVGFSTILDGAVTPDNAPPLPSLTMSPLTSLVYSSEVEFCNSRVSSILRNVLIGAEQATIDPIRFLVGELHDNVASHANGRGYSALQVYADHAEFAICDTGRGFLRNVRRVEPNIRTDEQAIQWALMRGNTTAIPRDPFAQRDEAEWDEKHDGNNHMGIGLWRLVRLIERTSGRLWIWSGDATYHQIGQSRTFRTAPIPWSGVMIEFEIPKLTSSPIMGDYLRDELDAVGEELGWS